MDFIDKTLSHSLCSTKFILNPQIAFLKCLKLQLNGLILPYLLFLKAESSYFS